MIEITDQFTKKGIAKLEVGQILIFQKRVFDDVKVMNYSKDEKRPSPKANSHIEKTELKITRINKGRIWAKEVKTYSQDEIVVNSGTKIETISEHFGK